MYERILVPIDGGELTERAISASIELAIQLSAAIDGFAVGSLPSHNRRAGVVGDIDDEDVKSFGSVHQALAYFSKRAEGAGVPYEGVFHEGARVDRAILEAAESHGCDMIIMVTHGRGAFGEFLYGSQTKAVLASSKLPLLILK